MDVVEPFVADGEAAIAMQPGERPLDDPARPTEPTAVRPETARQDRRDAAGAQGLAVPGRVVAAIALDAGHATAGTAGPTAQRRDRIDERDQHVDVGAVGRRQDRDERNALRFREEVVLGTRLAAIGWVRSSFFPPRNARSDELSTMARARSSWPRRRSSASSTSWTRRHTPACCHACSRRQQMVPEPQPISRGNRFHGRPVRSTNRMPVNTARSGWGFRPAYCRCRSGRGGSNGSTRSHRASSIENVAIGAALRYGNPTVPKRRLEYKD